MFKAKLAVLVLSVSALASADAGKPPSPDEMMATTLGTVTWKDAPAPVPKGVQVSPVAVDQHTKGSVAYAKFPAGLDFPAHSHSLHEYSVVLSGKATFTLDGKAHEVGPGSYIVIPPNMIHSLKCGDAEECILLTRRPGATDYKWVGK